MVPIMGERREIIILILILSLVLLIPNIPLVRASSEMWSQTYGVTGGSDTDIGHSVVETSDGGFALAGHTKPVDTYDSQGWLIKTDGYGNMVWNQTYGGAKGDQALSMVEVSDGGFALVGHTTSFTESDDFWLVKTDAYGIPEFPSWAILPILVASTLAVIVIRTKFRKKGLE